VTALEFENANRALWEELEEAAKRPRKELCAERFLLLYRTVCEHLALAEARGFPAVIVERLSVVTARAHQIVYRQSDIGWSRISRALLHRFPAAVRAHRAYVAVAALVLLVPALALGVGVYHRPELVLSLVDSATAARFERMYDPANGAIGRLRDTGGDWQAFGYYIKQNIGIAFQCYVSGILFGLGSLLFLAYNGLFEGAIGGYVSSCGYEGTFFPYIATHSAFELTAIVLSGAAGLRIGRSVLWPGRLRRADALLEAARDTSVIVFGAAVMLVIAAAIEAFFSSAPWVTPAAKYSVAAVCWLLVAMFFLRRAHAD
jgi:uncharacterized membrane protein SpoIIM required for sporulation